MAKNFPLTIVFVIMSAPLFLAYAEDEACEVSEPQVPVQSSSLLQVQSTDQSTKLCVEDGSQPCAKLKGRHYTSGRVASLDEAGYQEVAQLCCHHEMSLFVRREIQRQGFDVCDISDLHGFVHWYDCTNDKYTYAQLSAEIAGVMGSNCPWLGHLPHCPVKGVNCIGFPACPATFPANSMAGVTAPLTEAGYTGVALRCCHTEMEYFVRREIQKQEFKICDEGALQGFLHWFDCADDGQSYAKLKAGIMMAKTGLPPMCPWLSGLNAACPPKGHNCPWVENDPWAKPDTSAGVHRRRTGCR